MEQEFTVTWPEDGKVTVSDSCRTDITYLGVCVPGAKAIVVELSSETLEMLLETLQDLYRERHAPGPWPGEEGFMQDQESAPRVRHLRVV
jgi:hypothetical protein